VWSQKNSLYWVWWAVVVGEYGVFGGSGADVELVAPGDALHPEGVCLQVPGEAPVEAGEDLGDRVDGVRVCDHVEGCDAAGAGAEYGGVTARAGAFADMVTALLDAFCEPSWLVRGVHGLLPVVVVWGWQ
jgi:hypothetical protein